MKVALTCIAKDEDFYIQEWIDYNLKLGFDQIFIYENNWTCNINHTNVTKIPFPGPSKQLQAYNHFLNTYGNQFDYVAFFDCDEFLVLKKHNTIQEFLNDYNPKNGIAINWQHYGADNKIRRESNSLLKQFTKRENGINQHVKTILNTKSKGVMVNPHHSNLPNIDTNGKFFNGPFNKQGDDKIAIINHYYHKTFDDWKIRCARGRADCNLKASLDTWNNYKNQYIDVEDLTAHNFLYPN